MFDSLNGARGAGYTRRPANSRSEGRTSQKPADLPSGIASGLSGYVWIEKGLMFVAV